MSTDYGTRQFSSDFDAFKSNGEILDLSITFSGTLGASAMMTRTTSTTISNPDFYQIQFDNSTTHSGKFRRLDLEGGQTLIFESSGGQYLVAIMNVVISGSTVTITGSLLNQYNTGVNIPAAVINFKFIPYISTIG